MKSPFLRRAGKMLTLAGCASLLAQCNLFAPFDSPSGDAQLLSAARACFDRGDMDCAREYYAQVSGNERDAALAEQAFAVLDGQGATMAAFIQAFADSNDTGGIKLTKLANSLTENAGPLKRAAIFKAFKTHAQIENQELAGLVQFITSISLAAEILAETADETGLTNEVEPSDIVQDAAGCLGAICLANVDCNARNAVLNAGSSTFDANSSDSHLDSAMDLGTFNTAIANVSAGLSKMGASGGAVSGGALDIVNNLGSEATNAPGDVCYRRKLLDIDVGNGGSSS